MKQHGLLVATAMVGIVVSGCATPQGKVDNTATGAVVGGVTGAVIGSTAKNSGTGAAVGAAVGAVVGGAIGHGVDQARDAREAQRLAVASPQSRWQRESPPPPVTKEEVITMTRAKAGDEVIISHIRNSGTVFQLKTADIVALKKARVSDRVIDYMLNTPNEARAAAEVTSVPTTAPPPPIVEQVVVSPGPGFYWIGGDWLWINGGWSWRRGYWHPPYGYHYWHGRHW